LCTFLGLTEVIVHLVHHLRTQEWVLSIALVDVVGGAAHVGAVHSIERGL
jgi:hypothetical protein